ncbi:MAG: hypothetical protein Q9159_000211 [Coniocarpon cinnabarinum]
MASYLTNTEKPSKAATGQVRLTNNFPAFPRAGDRGYVAVHDIPEGTVIFREEALIEIRLSTPEDPHPDTREQLARVPAAALNRLRERRRPLHGELRTDASIFQNHALPYLSQFRGQTYLGIFDKISLVNHSCTPNAQWQWHDFDHANGDVRRSFMSLYASRTIRQGEEVTICYMPEVIGLDCRERRDLLQQSRHFQCLCEACTAFLHNQDDRRRGMTANFRKYIIQVSQHLDWQRLSRIERTIRTIWGLMGLAGGLRQWFFQEP